MKSLSIFGKTFGVALIGGVLGSHEFIAHAGPGAQLPGAQQQRAIDTEMRRQQKQQQLDALREKKRRQDEGAEHLTPLVIVPEEIKPSSERDSELKKEESTAPKENTPQKQHKKKLKNSAF